MNFDRGSLPVIPGLATEFDASVKEALFRVLKQTEFQGRGLDVFLYTRGGKTNAVWPLVSLLREFDPSFEVLVPYRCHSSGTLVALGAKAIHMGRLAELSPIDPTCGNQFNPRDRGNPNPNARLGISVEDVQAYRDFVLRQFEVRGPDKEEDPGWKSLTAPMLNRLVKKVHPLALGNVFRVHQQTEQLADKLLRLNGPEAEKGAYKETIKSLTTGFQSHEHMINRVEAKEILGGRVESVGTELDEALDALLGAYKKDFELWQPYFAAEKMRDEPIKTCRFIGGVVESTEWSYLFETNVTLRQFSVLPEGAKLSIPADRPVPILPAFPRRYVSAVKSQSWVRNEKEPRGVDK